jgi:hypothetical protein
MSGDATLFIWSSESSTARCEVIEGSDIESSTDRESRCYIRHQKKVKYLIDDLDGNEAALISAGSAPARLKSSGDVTLVTDQEVTGDVLGEIERPSDGTAQKTESAQGNDQSWRE